MENFWQMTPPCQNGAAELIERLARSRVLHAVRVAGARRGQHLALPQISIEIEPAIVPE
jgi:hypothetical protein